MVRGVRPRLEEREYGSRSAPEKRGVRPRIAEREYGSRSAPAIRGGRIRLAESAPNFRRACGQLGGPRDIGTERCGRSPNAVGFAEPQRHPTPEQPGLLSNVPTTPNAHICITAPRTSEARDTDAGSFLRMAITSEFADCHPQDHCTNGNSVHEQSLGTAASTQAPFMAGGIHHQMPRAQHAPPDPH